MLRNFTVLDVVGIVEASLLMTLILFIPGYVLGWLSNVFEFRERRLAMQVALSTPLAVAVFPVLIDLLGRDPKILRILFAASWLGFVLIAGRGSSRWRQIRLRNIPKSVWIGGAFVFVWAGIVIATLADLQFDGRLYFSSAAYDNSTHASLTAAASRSIPPANPFFAVSPPISLRYHYFWMELCSLVSGVGNIRPQHALYAGTVWAGIALMSLIVIAMKFFVGIRERFERKALIACSLLLITGLDILPTAYNYARLGVVTPDMEWWNEQITSWVDALLWAPHHIMSLAACMVGFLVLRHAVSTKSQRAIAIVLAGLAFSSAAGLSILTTFAFALFIALWLAFAALRREWSDVTGFIAAGAIALVGALPYLHTLLAAAAGGYGGGRFLAVRVRRFDFAMNLIAAMLHTTAQKLPAPGLILFLLLPLNYFLELGFFLLVGVLRFRSVRAGSTPMTRGEQAGWAIVGTSFAIGSFLCSTTIGSNDLGWRCFLQAQLVLLLWAAVLIDEWWGTQRFWRRRGTLVVNFAAVLLIFGLIGTVYQVAMLRAYPILLDAGKVDPTAYLWLDQDGRLGERTFALRSVYESLGAVLPADAVVQYNPYAPAFIPHQLYSAHSAAVGLPLCGIVFGGDFARCADRVKSIAPLFNRSLLAETTDLDSLCREYSINVMLVDDSDPVWMDRESWVWRGKPLLANEHVRAFACGDQVPPAQVASAR